MAKRVKKTPIGKGVSRTKGKIGAGKATKTMKKTNIGTLGRGSK